MTQSNRNKPSGIRRILTLLFRRGHPGPTGERGTDQRGHPEDKDRVPPDPASVQSGHEQTDANTTGIMLAGVGLLATLVVVGGVVWGLFTLMADRPAGGPAVSPLANARQASQAPPLERVPGQLLADTLRPANSILGSYGWVDRQARIVHLPIERAMDLIAERGLPVRSAPPQATTGTVR